MGFIEKFTENLERFEWKKYEHYIHRDLYRELIKIVSDIETSISEGTFIFGKFKVSAKKAIDVYSQLESEHLQSVCEKFHKIGYPVRNKQTYLRAMLYNEVFEYSATIANDVNVNEGTS